MANSPKRTKKKLKGEMADDLNDFFEKLTDQIRINTPVRTGRAQRGWREQEFKFGSGRSSIVIRNDVPYIEALDEGSSRKAPRGIVKPALNSKGRKR